MGNNVQEKGIMKPTFQKQWKEEEANLESKKTSKLIAYI